MSCYKVTRMVAAINMPIKLPFATNAELFAESLSEVVESEEELEVDAALSGPQSNSQKDVVVLNAPANIIAGLPVGLSFSSRNRIDSESISPKVRSA